MSATAITKEQRQSRMCQTDGCRLNELGIATATRQLNAILQQLLLEKTDMVDVRWVSVLEGDADGYFLIQAERPNT